MRRDLSHRPDWPRSFDALILAGRRGGPDTLAQAAGAPHRALIEVGGLPMLERVIGTLRSVEQVGRILVSIDRPDLLMTTPGLAALVREGVISVIEAAATPATSVVEAIDHLNGRPVLVTTADHALLTTEMVEQFLAGARAASPDLAFGLVPEAVVRARFPNSRRTYVPFREGGYSGANLFALVTPAARRAALFWRRAEQSRKQPWRLARAFGLGSLGLFLLGRLDLRGAMARASRRIGARIEAVPISIAEAAVDVDRFGDLELVRAVVSGVDLTRSPAERLGAMARTELDAPIDPAIVELDEAIRARHEGAVVATLFYGSCRRRNTLDGVLDFFVLVDDYRRAYPQRRLAWLNRTIPPNVFRVDATTSRGRLRAKYAVISLADFRRAARGRHLHPHVWGRFAQPARLVHVRDEETRRAVEQALVEAIAAAVRWGVVFSRADRAPVSSQDLWETVLRRSYGTELRTESSEAITGVVAAELDRYRAVTPIALELLARRELIDRFEPAPDGYSVELEPGARFVGRAGWWLRLPFAKTVAALRLLKGIATFDGWLAYVLWKLERHTGVRIDLSARQRRHPLIFGWPVVFRVLLRGELR